MQEELIQLFKNGNKQAGNDYYNANIGLVNSIANKNRTLLSDEEETFAIVNQAFAYSMKKVDLEKAKFSTYFAIAARGMILRHFRDCERNIRTQRKDTGTKTIVRCDSINKVIWISEAEDITLEDSLGQQEDYTSVYVNEALSKLTLKDRQAFKMQLEDGLMQTEIAKICGCGQVEVSRRIARAKASLRIILKEVS